MSDHLPIEIVFDGDSERYAKDVWTSLVRRAEGREEIRVPEDFGPPETCHEFRWKQLPRVEMRPCPGDRDSSEVSQSVLPHVEMRYDSEPFREAIDSRDEPALAQSAVDLLELVQHAYADGSVRPEFVYGVSGPHEERLASGEMPPPVTAESLAENRVEYACWLMGFPPDVVETYGRDRLLSAPAWQTAALPDGGVVVLATENPTNVSKPETRAIDQHLDLDPPPEIEDCRY